MANPTATLDTSLGHIKVELFVDGTLRASFQSTFVTKVEGFDDLATFILNDAGKPEYLRTRGFVAR